MSKWFPKIFTFNLHHFLLIIIDHLNTFLFEASRNRSLRTIFSLYLNASSSMRSFRYSFSKLFFVLFSVLISSIKNYLIIFNGLRTEEIYYSISWAERHSFGSKQAIRWRWEEITRRFNNSKQYSGIIISAKRSSWR